MEECYNISHVLFFASTKEGFGLPILEAQSCGLPVITSYTTSMPYVAGGGACIIDPYDVTAIRNCIIKIKEDKVYRKKLIDEGYMNIKRFSEQNFITSYLKVYKEIFK